MPTESKSIHLGTPCPDFELLGVDSKTHRLASYREEVLIIGFTCNHCPYVQAYEDRMNELVKTFEGRSVQMICINSNDDQAYPEDSFAKMKERASVKNFAFDYLRDDTQTVAKKFNAVCTPEFYVYDKNRILIYHGRLDDNTKDATAVKHHYLKEVIEDLLAKKEPRWQQTHAIGCSIKWKVSA
jgi:peroxiredoxin